LVVGIVGWYTLSFDEYSRVLIIFSEQEGDSDRREFAIIDSSAVGIGCAANDGITCRLSDTVVEQFMSRGAGKCTKSYRDTYREVARYDWVKSLTNSEGYDDRKKNLTTLLWS
jgi:hypothetical protein